MKERVCSANAWIRQLHILQQNIEQVNLYMEVLKIQAYANIINLYV